mmetsp:Transcript_25503/g.79854  ORF Transcript_25503/g.79854 Transcript_25503/m.79854 type:complete len:352 (-) Transcript_25503:1094-2149(-)
MKHGVGVGRGGRKHLAVGVALHGRQQAEGHDEFLAVQAQQRHDDGGLFLLQHLAQIDVKGLVHACHLPPTHLEAVPHKALRGHALHKERHHELLLGRLVHAAGPKLWVTFLEGRRKARNLRRHGGHVRAEVVHEHRDGAQRRRLVKAAAPGIAPVRAARVVQILRLLLRLRQRPPAQRAHLAEHAPQASVEAARRRCLFGGDDRALRARGDHAPGARSASGSSLFLHDALRRLARAGGAGGAVGSVRVELDADGEAEIALELRRPCGERLRILAALLARLETGVVAFEHLQRDLRGEVRVVLGALAEAALRALQPAHDHVPVGEGRPPGPDALLICAHLFKMQRCNRRVQL